MYGAFANAWSRRFMISILGDSGFSVFHAGHCDWQRPHSVQDVKSSIPFQVKSSIGPDAELGVLVHLLDVLEVELLAVRHQRLDRAERDRVALEHDVERRQEDVQVLGVEHDDEEDQHHADVQQQADALEHLERVVAQPVEDGCRSPCDTKAPLP